MANIGFSKPPQQKVAAALKAGDNAPILENIDVNKTTLIAFLRHIGCPFAEATVKQLRQDYERLDTNNNIQFVIVTHGDNEVAEKWLAEIGGYNGLTWLHDTNRERYGAWGIGYSNRRHVLSLKNFGTIFSLLPKGIRNRDASGTRWQQANAFLVGDDGKIKAVHNPIYARDMPSYNEMQQLAKYP